MPSPADTHSPPQPRRLKTAFRREGERLELRCRNPSWASGCFMVVWLSMWTVGCVFLAGMVIRDPKPFNFLFAIPFWASWVAVFVALLYAFFAREQCVLDHQGATFQRWALVPLKSRFIPLDEIHGFDIFTTTVNAKSGATQNGLEMQTAGMSLRFLQGLPLGELQWLRSQLGEHLDLLKQAVQYAAGQLPEEAAALSHEPQSMELEVGDSKPLALAPQPVPPPSDTRWQLDDAPDGPSFRQCGRFSFAAAGGLLFINLFWNGIVSVFVCELLGFAPGNKRPQGLEWWGLFLFLLPFEAIGLGMFVALLFVLLEPVRRTSWTFARAAIECRMQWLALGRTWTRGVVRCGRLEVRRDDARAARGQFHFKADNGTTGDDGGCYRLLFIDAENREVQSIGGLTEGEAQWIGDTVLRRRPNGSPAKSLSENRRSGGTPLLRRVLG